MSPRENPFDKSVLIRMHSDLHMALKKAAERERRTLADFCRIVLEDHVGKKRKGK